MKKLSAIILAGIMALSLAACGSNGDSEVDVDTSANDEPSSEAVEFEPITPEAGSITIGDYTLSAEYIPFDEPIILPKSSEPDMDVLGNTLYISDGDSSLRIYTIDGNTLTFVKELEIDTGDSIAVDGNGNIYADGGVFEATIYDADGNETGEAVASGDIDVSKTEDFALTYFFGRDEVTKISGGVAEPWVITGVGTDACPFTGISEIEIQGGTVLVGGEDNDGYLMAAFDTLGNQLVLSENELKGSLPNALAATANGYISTSVDDVTLIAPDGKIIGSEDVSDDLFGCSGSAWIRELTPMEDGSILAVVFLTKMDADDGQLLLYRINGF